MAKPIKETPILLGRDALKFEKKVNTGQKVSSEVFSKMRSNFEKLQSVSKF